MVDDFLNFKVGDAVGVVGVEAVDGDFLESCGLVV